MGKVIPYTGITKLDSPPERVLDQAKERQLEGVIVLGFDADGDEYFVASYADGGTILWLMERLKMRLLAVPDA